MIAGLILADSPEKDCAIAFLGDEVSTFTVKTNEEIVELVEERKPDVLAVNAGDEESLEEFTKHEKELREEGFAFTPTSHQKTLMKRLEALKQHMLQEMGAEQPEFIRFDPHITSEILAVHSDRALEALGVDTSEIGSSKEFDALVGAITARFYQQNQYRDLGIVIPEGMEE